MTIDPNDNRHIIADEGKVFKRIEDDLIFGNEIYLGYTWYINGIKLDEPKEEKTEDFEEIEEPKEEPIEEME